MTARTLIASVALLTLAHTAEGARYLYRPHPVDDQDQGSAQKGEILVEETTIQKGDTLFALARKHLGKGIYYPQFLLFNDIPDPNLIIAGRTIRIPLLNRQMHRQKERSARPAHPPAETGSPLLSTRLPEPVVPTQEDPATTPPSQPPREPAPPAPAPLPTPPDPRASELFAAAVSAYKGGDCRRAVELFDRFLAEAPASPLSADATLYRADCYLKLAGQ